MMNLLNIGRHRRFKLLVALCAVFFPLILQPVSAQVTSDDVTDFINKELDDSRTQKRLAEAQRKVDLEARSRRAGIVYKNPRFWASLPQFELGRAVFEGRFDQVDAAGFTRFYLNYFRFFSGHCRAAALAGPYVEFPVVTTTEWVRSDGTVAREGPSRVTGAVYVPSRFAKEFNEYLKEPEYSPEMLDMLIAMMGGGGGNNSTGAKNIPESILGAAKNVFELWGSLIKFNRMGCSSALAAQMQENLFRFSNDQTSVQASGASVANASESTDPLPKPVEYITIYQACSDYYFDREESWCSCISPILEKRLATEDYLRYVADFKSLTYRYGASSTPESQAVRPCKK